MFYPHISQWKDYGLDGFGDADGYSPNEEPEDWRMYGLPTWGAYADTMGIMSGDWMPALTAQVDRSLYGNQVLARTPMIELDPDDYRYVSVMKQPYEGMLGLGDDGTLYEWDGTLGFFRKIFRRVKKRVKKVARRIRKGVRRVLKKIPGGKYLMKLGKKVYKIASKIVKPLAKFVGRYAAKLAPVAALIPGYGPAIAGALYTAGKVANIMLKYGAKIKGVAGKVRSLSFPSGKSAKKFQKALKKEAEKMKRSIKKRKRMGARRARPARYGRRRSTVRRSGTSARRYTPRRMTPAMRRMASMWGRRR